MGRLELEAGGVLVTERTTRLADEQACASRLVRRVEGLPRARRVVSFVGALLTTLVDGWALSAAGLAAPGTGAAAEDVR